MWHMWHVWHMCGTCGTRGMCDMCGMAQTAVPRKVHPTDGTWATATSNDPQPLAVDPIGVSGFAVSRGC